MTQRVEPIEAVIISGPRKGEIVRLPEEAVTDDLSDEDAKLLNDALDEIISKIDRLREHMHATTEAWQKRIEEMNGC